MTARMAGMEAEYQPIMSSLHLDIDSFWHYRWCLRYVNAQDAILRLRSDCRTVDAVRQGKTSRKHSIDAFDAKGILVIVLLNVFSLTGDRNDTILQGNVDILLFHFRQLGLD